MNLQHNYWYFKSVLSKDFCENIIKYGNQQKDELALTDGFMIQFILTYIQQMKVQVGTFNGIGLNHVNLQNTIKDSFMVGTKILGMHLMIILRITQTL